ncbi:MAG: S1-like domain-containing RNA-binding protein [Verrucomicrobia bacterium]|nr:S1-like domain-containing RNA-binding protein [Verrucomicrobiota bacterium]
MAFIGKTNRLRLVRHATPGAYLDGEELGEILLPRRYVPPGANPGDVLEVFVHRDSEDRLVATTETPLATVGDFACLKVISVNPQIGAFLDWGLAKDLLLPFREQTSPLSPGQRVVVYVYLDPKTDRIVATARLKRHLLRTHPPYQAGQSVNLVIADKTPLGYNAIVEREHMGLLFANNLLSSLDVGQQLKGFVRAVHPDGKIDLTLDASGYKRVAPLADQIIEALKQNGGRLPFDDDSSPESIREKFGVSKKAFKQAIGGLYKARRIGFLNPGIEFIGGKS